MVSCDWGAHEAPEELLGDRERRGAAELVGPRRHEWVRARLTAKVAVRWATGWADTQIVAEPGGAPRVLLGDAPAPVAVSLAHTGDLIACAVTVGCSRGRIGVDVEPVDVRNDILVRRLVSAEDSPDLACGTVPGLRSTVLVSCKEAAFKAYRGPSPWLRDYALRRRSSGGLWVGVRGSDLPDLRVWRTCRGGVVMAVCGPPSGPPARRRVGAEQVLRALPRPSGRAAPAADSLPGERRGACW